MRSKRVESLRICAWFLHFAFALLWRGLWRFSAPALAHYRALCSVAWFAFLRITVVGQLLDVVHQGVELPLPVHLGLAAQRQAVELLVVAQVGEHRLDGGESSSIQCPALGAVDALLHALGVHVLVGQLADEERHLSRLGLVGRAQALVRCAQRPPAALLPRNLMAM